MKKYNLKSNLGKAIGLGSSGSGLHHWWHQRLSAIIMVVLSVWVLCITSSIMKSDVSSAIALLQKPCNIVAIVTFSIAAFYHAMLGMQVIIEDYVTCLWLRNSMVISLNIFTIITVISLVVALLYLMKL